MFSDSAQILGRMSKAKIFVRKVLCNFNINFTVFETCIYVAFKYNVNSFSIFNAITNMFIEKIQTLVFTKKNSNFPRLV